MAAMAGEESRARFVRRSLAFMVLAESVIGPSGRSLTTTTMSSWLPVNRAKKRATGRQTKCLMLGDRNLRVFVVDAL